MPLPYLLYYRYMRKVLFTTVLASFLAASAQKAYAADFTTSYNVIYDIQTSGLTQVTQAVSITNHTHDKYVSEYNLVIDSENISAIVVSDALGAITPQISKSNGQTAISVTFNDKVVGDQRTLDWTISYTHPEIASKDGQVWSVNLPRLVDQAQIAGYNITILTPKSFGALLYSSPYPQYFDYSSSKNKFTYTKNQFENTGVVAGFGSYQAFDFDLTYHLKNPNVLTATTQVALPPDILGEQEIIYHRISPSPQNVSVDGDGNYLAKFKLSSYQSLAVKVTGQARIYHPFRDLNQAGRLEDIPPELTTRYTQADKFWEVDSPQIQDLITTLATSENNVAQSARQIYNYVSSTLSYSEERADLEKLSRLGALRALENQDQAVCMEFTDLLITLLRAANIPARGLEGYAYTENSELRPTASGSVLHSWVQVYIPKVGWIPVDPTWGSTTQGLDYFGKLDTNHLVFAIKGTDSELPYPAGAYLAADKSSQDVKVSFANQAWEKTEETRTHLVPEFTFHSTLLGKNLTSGLPLKAKVTLKNPGPQTILGLKVSAQDQNWSFETLPPYGSIMLEVPVESPNWSQRKQVGLEAEITYQDFSGEVYSQVVESDQSWVLPFYALPLVAYSACVVGVLGVVGLGVWFVQRRK